VTSLGSSVTAFTTALQAGNLSAAAATVLDAPAVMANGFLNGQTILPLEVPVNFLGIPADTLLEIPLDGILAAPAPFSAQVSSELLFGSAPYNAVVTGTPISGILPGLLSYLPADLAAALGGPPAPVIPPYNGPSF
jgi:hypothetical protein